MFLSTLAVISAFIAVMAVIVMMVADSEKVAAWALLVIIVFAILPVIRFTGYTYDEEHMVVLSSQEIMAARDTSSLEGSFFLFGGQIDEEDYYKYYIEDEDGYITYEKIEVDRVKLKIIDDGSLPRIEVSQTCKDAYHRNGSPARTQCYCRTRIIYIPEGSIGTEFDLDNK